MTLVLLHGFTGAPSAWDGVRAHLPGDARVICPPVVGHGATGTDRVTHFEDEVDRIADALPRRGMFHLVGYSMGGRLALSLAIRHHVRVERLTLIACHPGIADESARRERGAADRKWISLLRDEGVEPFVREWEALPMWTTQAALPGDVLQRQRRVRLAHDPLELARALELVGPAAMPDYSAELCALDMPIDLLVGAQDARYVQLMSQMADELPRARLTQVPNAGHNVVLERPAAVAAALTSDSP